MELWQFLCLEKVGKVLPCFSYGGMSWIRTRRNMVLSSNRPSGRVSKVWNEVLGVRGFESVFLDALFSFDPFF